MNTLPVRTTDGTPLRRLLAWTATTAVAFSTLLVAAGAIAHADPAAPALHGAGHADQLRDVPIPGLPNHHAGDYIVTLRNAPVGSYAGTIAGLRATRPARGQQLDAHSAPARAYSSYLLDQIEAVSSTVGASPTARYTLALNGFAAHLTGKQADALVKRHDVLAVTPSVLHKVEAVSDNEFMGLEHHSRDGVEDGLWSKIGGAENAGQGIVVGDIDTGIAPENPSFAGDPLSTTPSDDKPWVSTDGTTISYRKSDGHTFTGTCGKDVPSQQWSTSDCSTKIIGARYFVSGFGRSNLGGTEIGEYLSPRDGQGHGTHTASTAVGEPVEDATVGGRDFGGIAGVAPAAKVAVYKACWAGPDTDSETDDGCMDEDLIAAIDQAVADGVDVINFSIGSPTGAQTVFQPSDQAFLGAAAAGIFVSASAGNEGSGASTADHGAPWYTTVAASTIPTYEATATFGDGSTATGASITVPEAGLSGPLVRADLVANPGVAQPDLCTDGSLDPAQVSGKVVVCTRGVNARVDKSKEVARAGGIGVILVNRTKDSLDLDVHSVPTIAIDAAHYDAISSYAATPGATVSFADGNSVGDTPPAPQVAGFSSRGPVEADGGDILKPDLAAPGVGILAGGPNAAGAAPTYEFMSGTSMAAPQVAGLAAIYLGEHPLAPPAEIKSALMTTASPTLDSSGGPLKDVFAEGAGQVDPTRFLHPGLIFSSGYADWAAYLHGLGYLGGTTTLDATQLNLPSIVQGEMPATEHITRTVTSDSAGTYRARTDLTGFDVQTSPSVLTFSGPGQTATFTVSVTRSSAPLNRFSQGSLDWIRDGDQQRVHMPLAFRPVDVVARHSVLATGGPSGSVEVPFTNGVAGKPAITLQGLVKATHLPDDGTADDPSHTAGTHSTDTVLEVDREVPDGLAALRFSAHAVLPGADYDLFLYKVELDDHDTVTAVDGAWGAMEGGPDESLVLADPEPGTYILLAQAYAVAGDVDFYEAYLPASQTLSGASLSTANVTDRPGATTSATVHWSGLDPSSQYLGMLRIATKATGVEIVTAATPAVVPTKPPASSPALSALTRPVLTGKARPGRTLTATPGTWSAPVATVSYQWRIGGVAVPGASRRTFVVPRSARGRAVTVAVSATAAGRAPATAVSAPALVGRQIARVALTVQPLHHAVRAFVSVRSSVTPTGRVTVSAGGVRRTVRLVKGHATVTLRGIRPGRATVRATYAGSAKVRAAHAARTMRVRR